MHSLHFLSSPLAEALGWTLLHAVWQGFALVLPTAVILHLLRNRSSALRYQLGTLTLLGQLVISGATFAWYYEPTVSTISPKAMQLAMQTLPVRWQTMTQTLPWHLQLQQFLQSHLSQFVFIYLIGVGLFGVRLAGGWLYLQRLTRTAAAPASTRWSQFTDHLRTTLAIRTVVQIRESSRIAVPMVVGMIKPVLLLPVALVTNLTTREIEAVLAHELAHIKRHDYVVNLLQSVVEVLYFFHPALWWLSARVREEREHCCDDLAVRACGGDGRILAQALAHVEELRLAHTQATPALAMAFASNRQHLLHRVRRVLGVPTRPFVSNGSLAGLTLATLLLMSVSVYAVQQQEKPKAKTSQPRPTRKHKAGNGTEFSITDNQKVEYIVWKGRKLPAKKVALLQHQLDQVMGGQLNLDDVKQPDRDILLTIIETTAGHQEGMAALAEGLGHIDYSNIIASALTNVPLSPDGTVEGLAKVDYNAIISDAFASVPAMTAFPDSLDKHGMLNKRQLDSLQALMAQRSKHMEALRLQMEKLRFPVEELQRSQEVLNWRKDKLMQQRNALIEKHQQLLYNESKQKLSQAEIEKQLSALEPEIKKLESSMEALNQQFEAVNAKEEEVKRPMEKLERESEQLEEQLEKLSEQLELRSEDLARLMSDEKMIERVYDLRGTRPLRARAPRATRSIKGLVVPVPPAPAAAPLAPLVNVPAPAPAPAARTLRGRGAVTPHAIPRLPKPVKAPKVERLEVPEAPEKPELPDQDQSSIKGQFQRLGAFVDSDPTIKTATFTFNPKPGQTTSMQSLTITKNDDSAVSVTAKPTLKINRVVTGSPKL